MKEYKKSIPVGTTLGRSLAILMDEYKSYEIKYSNNWSTLNVGDVVLEKLPVYTALESFEYAFDRSGRKAYSGYKIGFEWSELRGIVSKEKDPVFFEIVDALDERCYNEYIKRQEYEQKIAKKRAIPGKIAKVDTVIGATVICGLFIWGMIFIADQLPNILKTMENLFKTNKVENTAQQQSLPKDNEYKQTQSQIANYCDSLEKSKTR